jgi:hypothetical protein
MAVASIAVPPDPARGARYLVNAIACECPDYQQAGNICKNVRAVVLFEAGQQSPDLRRPVPGLQGRVRRPRGRPRRPLLEVRQRCRVAGPPRGPLCLTGSAPAGVARPVPPEGPR